MMGYKEAHWGHEKWSLFHKIMKTLDRLGLHGVEEI